MAIDENGQETTNPFLQYLKSVPGRLAMAPVNAIKLPGRVFNEITGNDGGSIAAENAQRQLVGEMTGHTPEPFSKGKQMANLFTLGIYPNNQSTALDPNRMDPQTAQNYGKATRLQQLMVTAKRPSDWADIVNDHSLFADEPAQKLTDLAPNHRLVGPNGTVVTQAEMPPMQVSQGASVYQGGKEVYRNDPTKKEFDEKVDPKSLLGTYTPKSISDYRQSKDPADLVVDTTELDKKLNSAERIAADKNAAAAAKPAKVPNLTPGENQLMDDFSRDSKPYRDMAVKTRAFLGTLGMNPGEMPDDVRSDLQNMGIDPGSIPANATSDLSAVVGYLKSIDPDSVARESEVAAATAARRLRMPIEVMKMLFDGHTLLSEQRTQLYRNMRDSFLSQMKGFDSLRSSYQSIAKKRGYDPESLIDYMGDMRQFIEGNMGGEAQGQAAPDATQTAPEGKPRGTMTAPAKPQQAPFGPIEPLPMQDMPPVQVEPPQKQRQLETNVHMIDQLYQNYVRDQGDPQDEQAFRAYAAEKGVALPR